MTPRGQESADRRVLEQAAHWLSVMSSGAPTPDEEDACRRWRAQAPAHERAWQHLHGVWRTLAGPAVALPGAQARGLVHQAAAIGAKPARARRSQAIKSALMVAAAVPVLWMLWSVAAPDWLLADYASGVGEQRVVVLDDDSRVVLNTGSAIDVRYSRTERRIVLRQGEILAVVAKEAGNRPFVVATRDGTVTARGTRYVVRVLPASTRVGVTESMVSACPRDESPAQCRDVPEGASVYLSRRGVAAGPQVDPSAEEAWTRHRLSVRNAALPDVLSELARYRRSLLWYDRAALEDLRVSGVFPLDGDEALAALADSLPIVVNTDIPGIVRIGRRLSTP